ncbi:WAT1-related protein, partial [Trifolium medium]|nr:WAT1-related protein [Trifolium medium]
MSLCSNYLRYLDFGLVTITSGVQYYIQGMVIKSMGPVIVTAFNPVRMIIVTALACIILSEQLFLG